VRSVNYYVNSNRNSKEEIPNSRGSNGRNEVRKMDFSREYQPDEKNLVSEYFREEFSKASNSCLR
jgi:hypothetical protein